MESLNTSPQPGFSRNLTTRPSESVMTMPNWSGSLTVVSPKVATAPFSLWNRTSAERSASVRRSPLMTRNVSFHSTRSQA